MISKDRDVVELIIRNENCTTKNYDTEEEDDDNNNSTFAFTLTKSNDNNDNKLNKTMDEYELVTQQQQKQQQLNIDLDNIHAIEQIFRQSLDRQIEGVVLFFLQEQGEISRKLSYLSIQKSSLSDLDMLATQNLLLRYNAIGEDILRLIHFVELNVMAVRKILKKHDKLYKSNKISTFYLSKSFMDGYDSHLEQLYHYGGISAVVASLKIAFYELNHHYRFLEYQPSENLLLSSISEKGEHDVDEEKKQSMDLDESSRKDDAEEGYSRENQSVNSGIGNDLSTWSPSRYLRKSSVLASTVGHTDYSTMWSSVSSFLQPEQPILVRIEIARRALNQSKEYVDVLAAQLMMDGLDTDSEQLLVEQDTKKELAKTKYQQISSFLNLVSTFLYMTNYYIVAPTCGPYAEQLGSSSAMSGIIIGMTPLAALIASILYAWWSNHSYKSALLFASFCCIMGDLLYALALHYNSLNMVIIGRYLNGFGSARAINRRYIADTFSRRERTAASAAFVSAGALGMAFGPATAAILGRLSYDGDMITVYTSPGWFMFILWTNYFVLTWLYFEDPACQKEKLAEKKDDDVRAAGYDEKKSLLSYQNDKKYEVSDSGIPKREIKLPSLWKNVPVMSTLWNYFVLKVVLECLLSSSAMLTSFYFNWDMTSSGSLLAILGLLMFPANLLVAKLSRQYDEREMIMGTLYLILFGTIGILYFWHETYTTIQYVIFAIFIFLGTNALEGPNMSLLSKTIPLEWAKGTFNSGLLATEAGTFGRVVGDGFISVVSFLSSDFEMLNGIYIPLLILVFMTIVVMIKLFPQLEPKDDEEEDDDTDEEFT